MGDPSLGVALLGALRQPFEVRVREHRKLSVTTGTFRGCLVVEDCAVLTRSDGQRVLDLASAIMRAGQRYIPAMLRQVHSHTAYAPCWNPGKKRGLWRYYGSSTPASSAW